MTVTEIYEIPALYDLVVKPGPCETFYRDIARDTGGPVLELACGTGRLTIPLARDGNEMVGLDASTAMLDRARVKAEDEGCRIKFVVGDMRWFALDRRFALIIVSCNSLAHLTSNEDLLGCFAQIRGHLAPGGLLAFDIVNPDLRDLARPQCRRQRLDVGPNPSSGIAIEEEAAYDPVQQIRAAQWRVSEPGLAKVQVAPLRLRQIFPQELLLLLQAAGLSLVARYGDFDRGPFEHASLNQICLARGT